MSTINLLPQDYLKWRRQHRANVVCSILFALVMVGLLCAEVVSEQSMKRTQKVRRHVKNSYQKAAELLDQMHRLEAKRHQMMHKAELAGALIPPVPKSTLLGVVSQALPDEAAMNEFSLEIKHVRQRTSRSSGDGSTRVVSAPKKNRFMRRRISKLTITGLASTDVQVAGFIANLARNPMFQSVDLVYSEEKVLRFQSNYARGQSGCTQSDGGSANNQKVEYKVRKFQVEALLNPATENSSATGGLDDVSNKLPRV